MHWGYAKAALAFQQWRQKAAARRRRTPEQARALARRARLPGVFRRLRHEVEQRSQRAALLRRLNQERQELEQLATKKRSETDEKERSLERRMHEQGEALAKAREAEAEAHLVETQRLQAALAEQTEAKKTIAKRLLERSLRHVGLAKLDVPEALRRWHHAAAEARRFNGAAVLRRVLLPSAWRRLRRHLLEEAQGAERKAQAAQAAALEGERNALLGDLQRAREQERAAADAARAARDELFLLGTKTLGSC